MFKFLQKIGKAFMLPIAILPAAGLFFGVGGGLFEKIKHQKEKQDGG